MADILLESEQDYKPVNYGSLKHYNNKLKIQNDGKYLAKDKIGDGLSLDENGVLKANSVAGIPFISGTQTAATAAWTGTAPTIPALFDGLTINYWLPYNSSANVTLNLTLNDGSTTGAVNVYYSGNTRLGYQYTAGNVITLTYRTNVPIAGSSTKYTGWWANANYDTNSTYSLSSLGITSSASAASGGYNGNIHFQYT